MGRSENSYEYEFGATEIFCEHQIISTADQADPLPENWSGASKKLVKPKGASGKRSEICYKELPLDFWNDMKKSARHIYDMRSKRKIIFGGVDIFGEPAWDIILDLFIRQVEGRDTSVTSSCIGSGVAHTTALRWINILEARDLLERKVDPSDGRRTFLRLTPKALIMVSNFLIEYRKNI